MHAPFVSKLNTPTFDCLFLILDVGGKDLQKVMKEAKPFGEHQIVMITYHLLCGL